MQDSALLKIDVNTATRDEITRTFCEEVYKLSEEYEASFTFFLKIIKVNLFFYRRDTNWLPSAG